MPTIERFAVMRERFDTVPARLRTIRTEIGGAVLIVSAIAVRALAARLSAALVAVHPAAIEEHVRRTVDFAILDFHPFTPFLPRPVELCRIASAPAPCEPPSQCVAIAIA